MITPRQEVLETGCIGEKGAALLYRTVWSVAASRNFPPPSGSARWGESAVTETAHDFLDGERGVKRVTDIAIRSVDDGSFERLLEAAVLNFLREASRRTDTGKLILRVTELLRDEEAFRQVTGRPARWTLANGESSPSTAPPASLATATATIDVVVPAWTSARRDPPLADRRSFVRLLVAVLRAAGGSLTAAEAAHAIAARLDHRRSALTLELDVLERIAEPARAADPAVRATSSVRAVQLFNALDDRERILVASADVPVRGLGDVLAVGHSQAALLRQRLHHRLRTELAGEDDAEGTLGALAELCDGWLQDRTGGSGATFAAHTLDRDTRRPE
jgi:hypothetical protein